MSIDKELNLPKSIFAKKEKNVQGFVLHFSQKWQLSIRKHKPKIKHVNGYCSKLNPYSIDCVYLVFWFSAVYFNQQTGALHSVCWLK